MIIHRSPVPDVEIPETTITEHILRRADELPDRVALMDGPSGRSYTYAQLREMIHRFAGGLQARGFGKGDVLGLMAPNIPEYAIAFHGTAVAGGTVTTINPTYGAEEVRFQLNDAGATLLVTIGMFAETAKEAIEGTSIDEVMTLDGAEGTANALELLAADPVEQVPVDLHDQVVVLPYSSGTTGLPKGVMLTHHNLVANCVQTEPSVNLREHEVSLAFLPFFHIYGMQVLMNLQLSIGATVITLPRFDLQQALELTQNEKITRIYAVPPVILALAKHPLVDEYDLSSLVQVFSGAAPLGAELAAEAAKRIECEVVQGYGMTELSPVSHCTFEGDFRPGTSGITVPNTETRIVDPETGEDQDVGGEGELWVRGPQVMKGYLNNESATRNTIDDDGWLHTGDVAVVDEHHHVSIVDRVKELIKYKGFQVPPAELEALLVAHPKVADVAVIGIPDEEAGEIPKAFIVRQPGAGDLSIDELQAYVAEHVASYKQVRLVEFIDEIPKSASGKILRRMLRDG
ncbi:4-coumarate--CoA ligase [Ilumatobacter fluminis]|uniref:4-coumarate--CoA ligase n=1 Tax=Ilumatobacter fluminis TaxID=467091 RepID=A0A4R7HYZ2_9ACTN|nr:AMP-binding protein [Ilumatobacter fluminis]TDT15739.1 4-coumarate--CoA ligase [Ilumatobacter fluminis]